MKIFILFLLISGIELHAQVGVYDKNCDSLARARENNFIVGTSDAGKRTERYFNWDQLSPALTKVVQDVNTVAPDYYKNPRRSPIISCKDSPSNPNGCLAFKAYCTENIALVGMKEEVQKWRDIITNCTNPKYLEKHPQHCEGDFDKSLSYIIYHSNKLAKAEQGKNPSAERYFKEASSDFSQFRDQLPSLLTMQKKIKEQEESEHKAKQLVKNCADVVDMDENDVKDRRLADRILNGMGACEADSLTNLNQPELSKLSKDMDKILLKLNVQPILDETNEIALKKAATAIWATHIQLVDGKPLDHMSATALVCSKTPMLCKNTSTKRLLGLTFIENQDALRNVKHLDESRTKAELVKFNASLKKMNSFCKASRSEMPTPMAWAPKKDNNLIKREVNLAVKDNTSVAKPDYEKGYLDSKLYQGIYENVQSEFQDTLRSPLGHLMMAKSLQEKVGVLNEVNIRKHCMGGGTLFHEASLKDIENAKGEFVKLTNDETRHIYENMNRPGKEDALKDYLTNNPLTIAELLKNNPTKEYSSALCALIRQINDRDEFKKNLRTAATSVGAVAGIALCATGIGTPVGASLLLLATGSSAINATNTLGDYFAAKKEAVLAVQSGATDQSTFQEAYAAGIKKDQEASETLTSFRNDIIRGIAIGGVGQVASRMVAIRSAAKAEANLANVASKEVRAANAVSSEAKHADDITDVIENTSPAVAGIEYRNFIDKNLNSSPVNKLLPTGKYVQEISKNPKWKDFAEKIKSIRAREAKKISTKRTSLMEDSIENGTKRKFPEYGYSRVKEFSSQTKNKSIDEAFEKFNPGQEYEMFDDGIKVIITPKNKVIGQEYVEIRYDTSGNYFRLQKGSFHGGKGVKIKDKEAMYIDWDGNIINTRGVSMDSPEFINMMKETHWKNVSDN